MYTETEKEYMDVCDGTQNTLLVLPDDVFHYNKYNTAINIESALDRIKELETQIKKDGSINEKNDFNLLCCRCAFRLI